MTEVNEIPKVALGSLQAHASRIQIEKDGFCPCMGTTDFGLPRIMFEYVQENNGSDSQNDTGN